MSELPPEGGIGPITRESTASVIARQLRTAMEDGSLPPGAQIAERELAGRMRVSRGPLREAMQRLVQEGLLQSEHNRGLFVTEFGPDDLHDIYLARTAIERAAAAAILDNDAASSAKRLKQVHRRMVMAAKKRDLDELTDADLGFHELLVAESQSARLQRMHKTLLVETKMCLSRLAGMYEEVDHVVAEHGAIVDAIADADRARLNELITEHANDALARLAPAPLSADQVRPKRITHL